MNISPQQSARVQATSGLISGVAGAAGGILSQFSQRRGLKAFAKARERFAQREAEERRRLGELEFREALERAAQIQGEANDLEAIGIRNAQAIRAEGERLVEMTELRNAASGLRVGGSAAEAAASAAAAAEFAASEEQRETSRQADALLFEAAEVRRAGRERRRASIIGAQSAINQGRFEAAGIRFRAPSPFNILHSALKPLQALPAAVRETLLLGADKSDLTEFTEEELVEIGPI